MSKGKAFLGYYNRGMVNGLFLSSGISGDVDSTMEKQIETVHLLRNKYGYDDYIHLKITSILIGIFKKVSLNL